MAYCPNCGLEVSAQAKFCERCGTALRGVAAPPAVVAPSDDAVLRAHPPVPPPRDLPFRLQEGESILKAFRPLPRVIVRIAMGGIAAALFLFFLVVVPMLSVFSIEPTGAGTAALQAAVALVGVLIAIILGLSILYGYLAYEKFRYWITNHRTVGRRGVVGFSVDSMPLENIADVIINRGILDRILGLSSVYVQPIGGAFSLPMPGPAAFGRLMGSNMFVGLGPADAVEIQQLVFHLRDLRKRETGRIL